ncbi:Scr1 family TA system antitoxin-like transcriptional regulator [Streptomyces sp. NPDC051555]|uniref:Scr1 family TA system antitoxin-like transcriptional regulator n=1 Tax=Streptomyces sp. NPDC051555 TaxID=3365657 RepID=UPI00379F0040
MGLALQETRHSCGWTGAEAVRRSVAGSTATLSRLEKGKAKAKVADTVVEALVAGYGVDEKTAVAWRSQAKAIMEERARPGGESDAADGILRASPAFEDILRLERSASEIISFAGTFVPGRVQTRQYSTRLRP